jgi:Tfp pilus assembly protein PilO
MAPQRPIAEAVVPLKQKHTNRTNASHHMQQGKSPSPRPVALLLVDIGGLVATLLLVTTLWFALVAGNLHRIRSLNAEMDGLVTRLAQEVRLTATIEATDKALEEHGQWVAAQEEVLPERPNLRTLYLALVDNATRTGLEISSVQPGRPAEGTGAAIQEISMAIKATGRIDGLHGFLQELQRTPGSDLRLDYLSARSSSDDGTCDFDLVVTQPIAAKLAAPSQKEGAPSAR